MNIDRDKYAQTFQLPDGDETPLHLRADLSGFPYVTFFERSRAGKLTPAEEREYAMRLMCYFLHLSLRHETVPPWLQWEIATRFDEVLQGAEWEKAFELPWTEPTPEPRKRAAAKKHHALGFLVEQLVDGGVPPEKAKRRIADEQNVSFKVAERAWLTYKREAYQWLRQASLTKRKK